MPQMAPLSWFLLFLFFLSIFLLFNISNFYSFNYYCMTKSPSKNKNILNYNWKW